MEKDNFIPFFINLKSKKILVIGGGKIAYRKVKSLIQYGGEVTVVTKKIEKDEFDELLKENNINLKIDTLSLEATILEKQLKELDIDSCFMVVAATDCKELNSIIYKYCDERNILVNNITSQEEMNTRFCKHFQGENFKIGISGGGDPKVAKAIEEKLISFINKGE